MPTRYRSAWFSGLVLLFAAPSRADDVIPPNTVTAVKHATVFIRVQIASTRTPAPRSAVTWDNLLERIHERKKQPE